MFCFHWSNVYGIKIRVAEKKEVVRKGGILPLPGPLSFDSPRRLGRGRCCAHFARGLKMFNPYT